MCIIINLLLFVNNLFLCMCVIKVDQNMINQYSVTQVQKLCVSAYICSRVCQCEITLAWVCYDHQCFISTIL